MAAVAAYIDSRQEPYPHQRLKLWLSDWAAWARRDIGPKGFPSTNSLWRIEHFGLFGAAIPVGYQGLPPLTIPHYIDEINTALHDLSRVDLDAYHAVVYSHIKRVPDRKLAEIFRVSTATFRRWRKAGYQMLQRRIIDR